MSLTKLWGEIEEGSDIDPNITNICHSVEMYLPKPHTIHSTHDDTPDHDVLRPPTQHSGQNTVLHAIDLIRHNRAIGTQKKRLRNKISKKGECEIPQLLTAPNEFCQDLPQPSTLRSTTHVKLCEVPAISTQTSELLLKKAAAAILCHVGFSASASDALDLLSQSLGNYLRRFCLQLRRQQDNMVFGHKTSHTDAFEATLYEQGIGGYQEFISFSKSLVIDYVLKLDDRRKIIEAEYAVIGQTPQHSARSMPGHYPHVNTIDLLKGSFEPEPESPSVEQDETRDVFMHQHQSNGLFFH